MTLTNGIKWRIKMDRETIEIRIQEGLRIQLMTWKSPLSELHSNRSKGQPEFIRNLDDNFYAYDNDEQEKSRLNKMSATFEQQRLAIEVMDLITYACKRHSGNKKAIVRAIISLRCTNLDNPSFGYGEISKCLKNMGIKLSRTTIKRRYDTAMDDLMHFYKK